nr:hypothetical protein [Tanacetum cinerariifolium]
VLLNNQNRIEKEKHICSEVHHRADSGSVPACVSTGRSDMVVAIIGVASPIFNVVPAANKDAAVHIDVKTISTGSIDALGAGSSNMDGATRPQIAHGHQAAAQLLPRLKKDRRQCCHLDLMWSSRPSTNHTIFWKIHSMLLCFSNSLTPQTLRSHPSTFRHQLR